MLLKNNIRKIIKLCGVVLNHGALIATPWTVATDFPVNGSFQARILGRLPFPTPGHPPNQRSSLHLVSPLHSQPDSLSNYIQIQ